MDFNLYSRMDFFGGGGRRRGIYHYTAQRRKQNLLLFCTGGKPACPQCDRFENTQGGVYMNYARERFCYMTDEKDFDYENYIQEQLKGIDDLDERRFAKRSIWQRMSSKDRK